MHPTSDKSMPSRQAFTLAEVMMATAVTLVALVGLVAAVTLGSEMLDVSRKQTVALQILHNEIDHVHLLDWPTVSTMPASASITINGTGTDFTSGSVADKQSFALTNYSSSATKYNLRLMNVARDFTCSLAISTVKLNLLQLKYTVTWTSGNRRKTYSRSSTTYYGKNGLNLYYQR